MNQSELEALLGRPLTATEIANMELYLEIATQKLEELLCTTILATGDSSDEAVVETRRYQSREGYSTVFTDIFTSVDEVRIDGEVVTPEARQWSNLNGTWFNSLVFDERQCAEVVEVDAVWGFQTLPSDLALLLAQLFAQVSIAQTSDGRVQSKKVEDFSITYRDVSLTEEFLIANKSIVSKYSLCGITEIQHGEVCYPYGYRI